MRPLFSISGCRHKCFPGFKCHDVIFSQFARHVLILGFTHFIIMFTLLMIISSTNVYSFNIEKVGYNSLMDISCHL